MNKCTEGNCERVAFFGVSGERERCQIHRNEQDINCSDIVCEVNKCFNYPSYGDGVNRYRCRSHAYYYDINMGRRIEKECAFFCIVVGCQSMRLYGTNGEKLRCLKHKLDGDVIPTSKCLYPGCQVKNPIYKKIGTRKGTHCYNHRPSGLFVSSKVSICIEEYCVKSARFGKQEDSIKLHCFSHCKKDEVNLSLKKYKNKKRKRNYYEQMNKVYETKLEKKRTLEKKLEQEKEYNQSDIEFYENIEKIFLNEENMFFSDEILFYL